MHVVHSPHEEPIPGYRLLEPLGRGGFGEVWKCEAPGGLVKAVKFVGGDVDLANPTANSAEQELRSLQHIKSIRHPFLLSIERVELIEGDLVLVTELADRSLHDLLADNLKEGRAGIDRGELLGYLREAAEVLDLMNLEHGLQHLDIKPRNLFLVGRHVKVGDFGLVNNLAESLAAGGAALGGVTPLYAAPETFEGKVTPFSDQYSLAVTYHELLTGELPFRARNSRQLILMVISTPPDLSRLSNADAAVVSRAMAKDPRQRFPSCLDFVEALEAIAPSSRRSASHTRTTSLNLPLGDMGVTAVTPETARPLSGSTRQPGKELMAPASDGVLPGYELLENLGRGPTGELWRARGPKGDARLVRFLTRAHFRPAGDSTAGDPLERLLALEHAILPELEVVRVGDERVALISEAGERTLRARLEECRSTGQRGIPRQELLAYLAKAAEALDQLAQRYRLQHLLLNPRCLALGGDEVLLMDFGLAELLWTPSGVSPVELNPRYSAPELFLKTPSDGCDQYSLALIFAELLAGAHPFRNLNARQMASPKLRGQPDLQLLPATDRPIVQRALDAAPEKRFRSCSEFVRALEKGSCLAEPTVTTRTNSQQSGPSQPAVVAPVAAVGPAWRAAVDQIVAAAGGGHEIRSVSGLHYRLTPGRQIEHRCWARLAAAGMGRLKLDGFREQWQGELLRRRTETRYTLAVRGTATLWQRCLGRTPGLVVEVVLGTARDPASQLVPVRVTLSPTAAGRSGEALLRELAPLLLSSLQTYLHSQSDRVGQERFPLRQPVEVHLAGSAKIVTGELRDIGRNGLCFYAAQALPLGQAVFRLSPAGLPEPVEVSGWVRDCLPGENGRFEIESAFAG